MSEEKKPVPTMLYRPGNQYTSEGVSYDTTVVDESEVAKMKKQGWFEHFSKFPED